MTKQILVVDDDPVVGILINEYLAAQGFNIELLNSGGACLERLRLSLPDLLILDLQMPDMTGIEVLKNIRANQQTKNLPVIMMSADNGIDELLRQHQCSADSYVEKPFEPRAILEAISALNHKK